jgi:antitoxin (DNA-binding transcriptional repressor) of toxin-antitoxin stability system
VSSTSRPVRVKKPKPGAPPTIDLPWMSFGSDKFAMRTATLAKVKEGLASYIDQCEDEGPLVITRNGKAVAVLFVPIDEDDIERFILPRLPRFQAMLDHAEKSIDEGKGLSHEEFWKAAEEQAKRRKKRQPSRTARKKSSEGKKP